MRGRECAFFCLVVLLVCAKVGEGECRRKDWGFAGS